MENEYKPLIPQEPIPIALSFSNEGRITSITTAREGATTVDAQSGCTLGYWIEVNKYEELLRKAAYYDDPHADGI
jgi:hypothetical protein